MEFGHYGDDGFDWSTSLPKPDNLRKGQIHTFPLVKGEEEEFKIELHIEYWEEIEKFRLLF